MENSYLATIPNTYLCNMNTRLRFKIITLLISISLLGLLTSQGYWLAGLYKSTLEKTEETIQDAMRIADYKEMFIRINQVKKEPAEQEQVYSAHFSANIGYTDDSDIADKDSITSPDTTQVKDPFQPLQEYLEVLEQLESLAQSAMHQKIDSIAPIDYAQYDSLLTLELNERDILTPHKLEIIKVEKEEPFVLKSFNTAKETSQWKGAAQYKYPITTDMEYYYLLYISSPQQVVFRQMAGILISSSLLVLTILIAFVYLIYTILRQKTVEELKTDFTNNMTHELKTPISVAFAANDVLLNYSEPVSEKQQKYLHIVQEQLTHLSGLVEQILTLSVENRSTFRLKPEPIAVAELLQPLVEQQKLKAVEPLNITTDIPAGLTLTADRTHLYNMVGNLVENAIKYSGEKPCRISIKAVQLSDEICLSVSDNGIGISDANQKRIFDKFFRVPSGNLHNVKGYGLGLYYVKDMMEKHGGSIHVKSLTGKGSTFTLHFKI